MLSASVNQDIQHFDKVWANLGRAGGFRPLGMK